MKESLPNITGGFNLIQMIGADSAFGAFEVTKTASPYGARISSNQQDDHFTFNASRSSSTYQDNTPVRPLSITTPFLIKY